MQNDIHALIALIDNYADKLEDNTKYAHRLDIPQDDPTLLKYTSRKLDGIALNAHGESMKTGTFAELLLFSLCTTAENMDHCSNIELALKNHFCVQFIPYRSAI